MEKIYGVLKRNIIWVFLGIGALLLLKPAISELNTLLLIVVFESLALGLSGAAAYAFTHIDFIKNEDSVTLTGIFASVHILVGLAVVGVYLAQFAGV